MADVNSCGYCLSAHPAIGKMVGTLAVKGVTDALATRDAPDDFRRPQIPLIIMALLTVVILVAAHRWIVTASRSRIEGP